MTFVLNSGSAKTVKLCTGMIRRIPKGATSLPDDKALDVIIGMSGDLKEISREEFFKINNKTPIKETVKKALDERKTFHKELKESSDVKKTITKNKKNKPSYKDVIENTDNES